MAQFSLSSLPQATSTSIISVRSFAARRSDSELARTGSGANRTVERRAMAKAARGKEIIINSPDGSGRVEGEGPSGFSKVS